MAIAAASRDLYDSDVDISVLAFGVPGIDWLNCVTNVLSNWQKKKPTVCGRRCYKWLTHLERLEDSDMLAILMGSLALRYPLNEKNMFYVDTLYTKDDFATQCSAFYHQNKNSSSIPSTAMSLRPVVTERSGCAGLPKWRKGQHLITQLFVWEHRYPSSEGIAWKILFEAAQTYYLRQ